MKHSLLFLSLFLPTALFAEVSSNFNMSLSTTSGMTPGDSGSFSLNQVTGKIGNGQGSVSMPYSGVPQFTMQSGSGQYSGVSGNTTRTSAGVGVTGASAN